MKKYFFFFLLMSGLASFNARADGAVAIIVNHSNTLDSVPFHQLVQIFKQEKQFWSGTQKIYVLMMGNSQDGKDKMLSMVYQMPEDELKKTWIEKLYRAEISDTPKVVLTPETMKKFVASISNSIGFINMSDVDSSVKVLKIDGKGPSDEGYPLK